MKKYIFTNTSIFTPSKNNKMDVFLPVKGFENYLVNAVGDVYSFNRKRLLKPNVDTNGYHQVKLYKNSKPSTKLVHRLVAEAFLKEYTDDLQVDHLDGVLTNNRVSNLKVFMYAGNLSLKKTSNRSSSGYVGIYWCTREKKWVAQISTKLCHKNLGYFDTVAEAREARDKATKKYYAKRYRHLEHKPEFEHY